MAILDDLLKDMPEQFKNKPKIEALLKAFAKQMEEVSSMLTDLLESRTMSDAVGTQLDHCGDIVGLNRAEAALYCSDVDFDIIDDERYRLFVKYKALRNGTQCTYHELIAGLKLLLNADPIYYTEDESNPASFNVSLGVDVSEDLISLISSTDLSIRASGVKPYITCFSKEFFGFSDTNRYALGFGTGKFSMGV